MKSDLRKLILYSALALALGGAGTLYYIGINTRKAPEFLLYPSTRSANTASASATDTPAFNGTEIFSESMQKSENQPHINPEVSQTFEEPVPQISESEPEETIIFDFNTAGVDELMTLPGIGEVKAAAIVAFREENGGISRIDDLLKVNGIGEKTLESIKAFLEGKTVQASDSEAELNEKININTATADELTALYGIGEAKAAAIIEYREKSGEFFNIEEIMDVTGIGEAIFAKIKENITV